MNVVTQLIVNPSDRRILKDCADIHMQSIPDGFLPTFGATFLFHLYDYLASNDRSFLVVAISDGVTEGFICGSYGLGSLYRKFATRKFFSIIFPIGRHLLRKGVLKKTLEVLRYPTGSVHDELPGSEILNFCVAEGMQGKGVGKKLFSALCDEYSAKGIRKLRIVTGSEQKTAQWFYESKGAQLVSRVQIHGGDESLVYTYIVQEEIE